MKPLPLVSAKDPSAQARLQQLHEKMAGYYNRPEISSYYDSAHSANAKWSPNSDHQVLRSLARPGMKVVDLGCGSGHSFLNLRDLRLRYTGVDISQQQIAQNERTYGTDPQFVPASLYDTELPAGQFDLVFSTYVLEHLVWPHLFLKEASRLVSPGGHMVLICPHFRPFGRIPSLRFGKSVATLRQRMKSGSILAGLKHLYLRNVYYPRRITREFPPVRNPFLINLEPTCLNGPYYPDNDAVYFTDRREISKELEALGLVDCTALRLRELHCPHPLGGVCIVIAHRP